MAQSNRWHMVLDILLGFLLLVAASYLGTMMALRGFFGRKSMADSPSVLTSEDISDGSDGDKEQH